MKIKMPKTAIAVCSECSEQQLVTWGSYGSESACYVCDAAPSKLNRIA